MSDPFPDSEPFRLALSAALTQALADAANLRRRLADAGLTSDEAAPWTSGRLLTAIARDALIRVDAGGRIVDVNPAGLSLFGPKAGDPYRMVFDLFADPEIGRRFWDLLSQTGWVVDFEAPLGLDALDPSDGWWTGALAGGEPAEYLLAIRDLGPHKAALEALRKSEIRFRSLSENAPDIIYTIGESGSFTYVNPAWQRILGHPPDQVLGRYFIDFVPERDKNRFRSLYRQIRSQGVTVSDLDAEFEALDGTPRSFSLSGSPFFDDAGGFRGVVGVFRDNTGRRLAERELEVARTYADQMIESAPEAIVVVDNQDIVRRVNSMFTRVFQYTPKEALGRPINDLIVPMNRKGEGWALTARAGQGEAFEVETQRCRKDGGMVDVSLLTTPIWIEGLKVGVIVIYRDITQRKTAEAALVESERRFREMADLLPAVVAELDGRGFVTWTNRLGFTTFGIDAQDLETGFHISRVLPPDELIRALTGVRRVLAGETIGSTEYRMVVRDGSTIPTLLTAAPMESPHHPHGLRVIVQDVSRQKKNEAELLFRTALLDGLIECAPEAIVIMDGEERIIRVNPEFTRLFGFTPEQAIGRNIDDLVVPPERDEEGREASRRGRAGQALFLETIRQARNGRRIPVSILVSPIRDMPGGEPMYFAIYRDISTRIEAETALRVSEEKYRGILERIQEGYLEIDAEDRLTFFNDSFCRQMGRDREALQGQRLASLATPRAAARAARVFAQVRTDGQPVLAPDFEIVLPGGDFRFLSISLSPLAESASSLGLRGVSRDLTERRKAQMALRESEERHRTFLETVPDPVIVRDADGDVTYVNQAFTDLFGWSLSEVAGGPLDFIPQENTSETWEMEEKLKRGRSFSGVETRRQTGDGRLVDVSVSGAVFLDEEGAVRGSVLTLQDISERKRAEKDLKYVAFHDLLTGLPNRKAFYEKLEDTLNQAERRRADNMWALLFLDLDKFKNVNDSLGHDIGDDLLRAVAVRVKDCLRRSDHIFRLGGDEFTVILTNLHEGLDVAKVAQKIRESVARPFQIKGHDIYTSGSLGISVWPSDGLTVEALVKNADMAMYAAKEGRDGYRFYTEEMHRAALERMKLESSLRQALDRCEFILHYQPLMGPGDQVLGVEALIRWRHPELGLVPPAKFISLAEESGLIVPIGDWVLRTACAQTQAWRTQGSPDLYVAVNLSPRQFRETGLVEGVARALVQTGLPADRLQLELTESCVMEDPEEAIRQMKRLREMGVHLSIDDFGTGYSSLSYLRRLPIDTLKIDRSFMTDALENKDDREIVKTIIAMARNLNIQAVAEGVETVEHKDFLRDQGCQLMQGFYFSRPLSPLDFEAFMTRCVPTPGIEETRKEPG